MHASADRAIKDCSCTGSSCGVSGSQQRDRIRLLQTITLGWMFLECSISLFAAYRAHSPLLLAFGADSFVELLSVIVVLWNTLQIIGRWSLPETIAGRMNGVLLFVLAAVVVAVSALSFMEQIKPQISFSGMIITAAALVVMPILSFYKRHIAEQTGNVALAADAVQSATCAYLALITLAGLASHALFHIPWIDSVAALAVVPILLLEGRRALRGEICCCC